MPVRRDVNGFVTPQDYKNMTNSELITELTNLKTYEAEGTIRQIGYRRVNSHNKRSEIIELRDELKRRGIAEE